MSGNKLIDDYLSELMEEDAAPPAAADAAIDDARADEATATDAPSHADADAPPVAADPLAAFRTGSDTIGDDEFEAMLDAMQGRPAAPASAPPPAPAAAEEDPLAAFRSGGDTIGDDEFEAMLDAMQGRPAAPVSAPAPAGDDPLAAFRGGGDTIGDDEFEAMLDVLQGRPVPAAADTPAAATAAPAITAPTPPAMAPAPLPAPKAAAAVPTPPAPPRYLESLLPPQHVEPVGMGGADGRGGDRRRRADERVSAWLRFSVARQQFAVEVLKVQEVLRLPTILPVRGTEPAMLGVMNLRGQIVPVLDLAIKLGFPSAAPTEAGRVIVLEENGETLGLQVAAVADVSNISDARIERISGTASLVSVDIVRGIARRDGNIVILLDASRLLA